MNIVQDPEAFEIFIKRQKKLRDDREKDRVRNNSKPGSGRYLTNNSRITKPQTFNLLTESKDFSCLSIKSVHKVWEVYLTIATWKK
jgi:hypothetical protein